ncbi:MAG TPA: FKBP-type peptidyl-prolyl cis-trans isomerase [Patescibacteria group bacterium]
MDSKNFVLPAAIVLLLLVAAISIYATNSSQSNPSSVQMAKSLSPSVDVNSFPDFGPSATPTLIPPASAGDTQPSLSLPIINSKPTMIPDTNKLIIEDQQVGTGAEVKAGDTVVMNYVGTLLDGTKFDSSYDRHQAFTTRIGVGQVIKGWDEGVIGMKVGGKRRLIIPSDLAYGDNGIPGAIPPKATLVFDVELLNLQQ